MSEREMNNFSRCLTKILRHDAEKLRLTIRPDGYCTVNELLQVRYTVSGGRPLASFNLEDVKKVVKADKKQRFSLIEEAGQFLIRANQGHTLAHSLDDEQVLTRVTSAHSVPSSTCVHGTYHRFLPAILSEGLKPMGRRHVHFATDVPGSKEVISGMRSNCEVCIYLDLEKALADEMPIFLSSNNVILTAGLRQIVDPKYFSRIVDRKSGNEIEREKWEEIKKSYVPSSSSSSDSSSLPMKRKGEAAARE